MSESIATLRSGSASNGKLSLPSRFFDFLRPIPMVGERVDAEPDGPDVMLVEGGFEPRHFAEFGRAYRRKNLWMRKQDCPAIADPLVEIDRTFGRILNESGATSPIE
jgi:hypothetical protein